MFFHLNEIEQAKRLVKQYHYSHRWPSNVQLIGTWHEPGGLFGDSGDVVAACVFSIPGASWLENVWELSRLVRKSEVPCPPLTGLIALTCKWAKRKGAHLLVSYADKQQSHHGGIYRAASWNYNGLRAPKIEGVTINGQFIHGRTANHIWGTQSPKKLIAKNIQAEPHYDEGKHLYWRALTNEGRRRAEILNLKNKGWDAYNGEEVTYEH